jgi:hypothetical protein
MSSEVTYVR